MSIPPLLAPQEPQLRIQLPASLYASLWVNPTIETLTAGMQHLYSLNYLLSYYLPHGVVAHPPQPGQLQWQWQTRTLMFTDLAGFTSLTQTCAQKGVKGAQFLADLLNTYFSKTLDVISVSGGDLLEFTGDAILVEFADDVPERAIAKAIRAGLRLQRMMAEFAKVKTLAGESAIAMRVGIHSGRFLAADVGTPMRMVRILLGQTVRQAKQAEGVGVVGRVCVTQTTAEQVPDTFRYELHQPGYVLVHDDFDAATLGNFEITLRQRRNPQRLLMLNRTSEEVSQEISQLAAKNVPLTTYIAPPVLKLLVENASDRSIPPMLSRPTILFVNLLGLPEAADKVTSPAEETQLIKALSYLFAQINGLVEAQNGFLQKWTYHLYADILICFGIPNARIDNAIRAATVACQILQLVTEFPPVLIAQQSIQVACQIGLAWGTVFAGEIGQSFGRRDYNALGNPVNGAAYLMSQAAPNQILMTDTVEQEICREQDLLNIPLPFRYRPAGELQLKGHQHLTSVFELFS
ncbi:MAG: adenylate/guanylate cyclase domain-containing protein [Cyanobacteria bacterium P01_F01_bin.86]